MDQLNFIMQPIDFHHTTQKCHCHMYYGPPVKNNQLGTEIGSCAMSPTVTLLCGSQALRTSATLEI